MKIFIVSTWLSFFWLYNFGQGQYSWIEQFGSYGEDMGYCIHYESGYTYIGGWFEGSAVFGSDTLISHGGQDMFLLCRDLDGLIVWAERFGGIQDDFMYSLVSDYNGSLYFSGTVTEQADFGTHYLPGFGAWDAFLCRISTNGIVKWAISAGTFDNDQAYHCNVSPDADFIALAGYFNGDSSPAVFGNIVISGIEGRDFFTARIDTNGTFQWVFNAPEVSDQSGYGIDIDTAGNVYVASYYYSYYWHIGNYNLISNGEGDVVLLKLSSSGNLYWAKNFGGIMDDIPRSVYFYKQHLYIGGYHHGPGDFLGVFLPGKGGKDSFLIKTNLDGTALWGIDGISQSDDEIIKLDFDNQDNIYSVGGFAGYLMVNGQTIPTYGEHDAYCIKIDHISGLILHAFTGGGNCNDGFFDVSVAGIDTVQLAGYFQCSATFGPYYLNSNGQSDIMASEYSGLISLDKNCFIQNNPIVYPNPANDFITIKFSEGELPLKITLYNANLLTVKEFTPLNGNTHILDCSTLPSGIYTLILQYKEKILYEKVIIVH